MTSETCRRVALYAIGVLVLAGLGYFGFVYEAEPDLGQLVASAEVCAKIGSSDDGIQWAERGLKIDPDHRYLHIILARCYERKDDPDRAAGYYARAVELSAEDDPQREILALHRAEALSAAGHADDAVAAATAVTRSSPDLLAAWYVLGRLHLQASEYDQAEAAFDAASERARGEFEPVALLAATAEKRGDEDRALELYRKAELLISTPSGDASSEILATPEAPETQVRRSELRAVVLKHAEILLALARLQAARGEDEKSVERLEAAARLQPGLVKKVLRTEPLFAPFRESEHLRAVLAGEKSVEKGLKPLDAAGR